MATISTHTGSSVSRGHNIRDERCISKDDHIDLTREHEVWIDEAPRKAYERIFGDAVREYNEKQTRNDRKIKDYYKQICEDGKKHPVYEMVAGVYPAEGETITDAQCKSILRQFVKDWQKRNPNLEIIGAYYHADEEGKAPHVHIDYIPVAHGYKRGMGTQTGLDRALQEQGFKQVNKTITPQIQWEARENQYLEKICNLYGYKVEHPEAGKGVKHLHTDLYKVQQDIKSAEKELSEVNHKVADETQKAVEYAKIFFGDPDEIQKEANEAQARVDTLKGQESGLQAHIDSLTHDKDTLVHETADAFVKRDKAVSEARTATKDLEGIQKDIEDAKTVLEGLQGRILTAQETRAFTVKPRLFGGDRAILEGTPEELQSLINTASKVETADKTMQEAQRIQANAKKILNMQRQITADAEKEAERIRADARTQADRIKGNAAEQVEQLRTEKADLQQDITNLKGTRANLENTVKKEKEVMLEDARIEADQLIKDAMDEIGQGRVYDRLQDMIGIVPQVEVKEAREEMLQAYKAIEKDMTAEEKQLFTEQRTEDLYQSLSKHLGNTDMRAWGLRSKMNDYFKKLDSPRTAEEVKQSLAQSLSRNRGIRH